MIILTEILLLALLSVSAYCLFKYSLPSFLKGLACYGAGFFVSFLTFKVSLFIFGYLLSNILLQLIIAFILSLTAFVMLLLKLCKLLNIKLEKSSSWRHFLKLKILVLLSLLAAFIVAAISVVNILSADPDFYKKLEEESLFCSFLLPEKEKEAADDFWQNVKTGISRSTGSQKISDNIRALNFLLTLEPEEYPELISENAALKSLLNEPALKAIEEDTGLMELFIEEELSLTKIYKLAENEKVKALLKDEKFLRAVRQIDLLELEKQTLSIRASKMTSLDLQWSTLGISSSLMLDESIKNGNWQVCTGRVFELAAAKYSLLKVRFKEGGHVSFHCQATVPPIVIYRDESEAMKKQGDTLVFELDVLGEEDVVFLFEFPEKSLPCCEMQAFLKKKSED